MYPVTRVVPTAYIHAHIGAPCVFNRFGNGGVAFLLVEVKVFAIVITYTSTEIDLDEVEAEFLEEKVAVLLVMSVEADAFGNLVTSMIVAAGVLAAIGVDACLHLEGVDIIDHRLQAIRETGGMDEQLSRFGVTSSEVAVVDVDVVVADFVESLCSHGSGLSLDDIFVDVEGKGVPRTPTHSGLVLCVTLHSTEGKG